jgi:hypothetical protein
VIRPALLIPAAILLAPFGVTTASDAAGARWAIKPASLVLAPSGFSGLAGASVRIATARSAMVWTIKVQQESPKHGRAVAARLKREGFREGVAEYLTKPEEAIGLSAAEVLGSTRAASNETTASVRGLQHELGAGTTTFSVAGVPGAVGLQQTSLSLFPDFGIFPTMVDFPAGRCMMTVLLGVKPSVTPAIAERETVMAALHLYHQVERRCA